jgi:hypothetical protein
MKKIVKCYKCKKIIEDVTVEFNLFSTTTGTAIFLCYPCGQKYYKHKK